MGKVGARDLCDNYFIAFADLHFQITNPAMVEGQRILQRHLPPRAVSSIGS